MIKGDKGKEAADNVCADKTWETLLSSITIVPYQLISSFRCYDKPVTCTECCQSCKMAACGTIFSVSIFLFFH